MPAAMRGKALSGILTVSKVDDQTMTITLNLAPEVEAQLNGVAARQGQEADRVACSIFAAGLA